MLPLFGGWLSRFCPTRLQDAIDHLTGQISSARSQMEQEQERFEKKFLEKIDHLFLAIKEKSVRLWSWGSLKSIPTPGVIGRAQLWRQTARLQSGFTQALVCFNQGLWGRPHSVDRNVYTSSLVD